MESQTKIYLVLFTIFFIFSLLLLNGGRIVYKSLSTFSNVNSKVYYTIFILFFAFFITYFVMSIFSRNGMLDMGVLGNNQLIKLNQYIFGLATYIVAFGNVAFFIHLLAKIFRLNRVESYDTIVKFGSAALILTIVGLFVFGAINSKFIKIKKYNIDINSFSKRNEIDPVSLENIKGLKIALISDTHLGYVNDNAHLQKIVNQINKLDPDIVLIPGDIFDDNYYSIDNPEETIRIFKSIKSKYGVYATLGNHDSGGTIDLMINLLKMSDVKLLQDEKVIVDNKFVLIGRSDGSPIGMVRHHRTYLSELSDFERSLPVIAMDHRPERISEFSDYTDLLVCGHTHNGQYFPFSLAVNRVFEEPYGHYTYDDGRPQLIVTSGAGTWGPPLRVGSDSEVVEIVVE